MNITERCGLICLGVEGWRGPGPKTDRAGCHRGSVISMRCLNRFTICKVQLLRAVVNVGDIKCRFLLLDRCTSTLDEISCIPPQVLGAELVDSGIDDA